jgi:glucose-6-phosphate isomerase, archaeal
MLDLTSLSGLPMSLDDNGHLILGREITVAEAKVRLLDELTAVALDPAACRGSHEIAYYMYSGIYREADYHRLGELPLRYELTLMPPGRIGRELLKTHGHIHSVEPISSMTYPEICEVLVGTAHFITQSSEPSGPTADLVLCVEVKAGQKIILPSGMHHCMINAGSEPLLVADVVAVASKGIYSRFRNAHGAAYLEIVDEEQTRFIPNPVYKRVAPLQRLSAREYPEFGLTVDQPLYTEFLRHRGENWPFLADPHRIRMTFPKMDAIQRP